MSKREDSKGMVTNLPNIRRVEFDGTNIYPLAVRQSNKIWNGQGRLGSLEYQDLIGEVLLATAKGHTRFRRKNKVKFSTFIFRRMSGAALDAVRRELNYAGHFEPTDDEALVEAAGGSDGLESTVSDRQSFLAIIDILERKMAPRLSKVLVRSFLEDQPDSHIAKEIGCRPAEVPALRDAAIKEVRRLLLLR